MTKRLLLIFVFGALILTAAFSQITVMGTLTRHREAVPGEEYEGIITLKNAGKETAQAKVYLKDYTFMAEGETGYPEPGSIARSNAGWITLSSSTAVLAPGEIADIKYTLNIPSSDSLAGTYWSMIFIEGIPEKQEYEEGEEPTISIRQVLRYGLQIVTDFSEGAEANLGFTNTKIIKTEEGRFFSVDLNNSGTLWLNGDIYMEVYSTEGEYVTTLDGGQFRTYPQTSLQRTFNLDGLAAGTYKALLIADAGGDNLFGGNYNLVLTE